MDTCEELKAKIEAVEEYNSQLADAYSLLAVRLQRLTAERLLIAAAVKELATNADLPADLFVGGGNSKKKQLPASNELPQLSAHSVALLSRLRETLTLDGTDLVESITAAVKAREASSQPIGADTSVKIHNGKLELGDANVRLLLNAIITSIFPNEKAKELLPEETSLGHKPNSQLPLPIKTVLDDIAPGYLNDVNLSVITKSLNTYLPRSLVGNVKTTAHNPPRSVFDDLKKTEALSEFLEETTLNRFEALANRIFTFSPDIDSFLDSTPKVENA